MSKGKTNKEKSKLELLFENHESNPSDEREFIDRGEDVGNERFWEEQ